MADSGIKINQLPVLEKVTGSDIAVVIDSNDHNRTKQTCISSFVNYISPGSAVDLSPIRQSINTLNSNVAVLSDSITTTNANLVANVRTLNNSINDINNSLDTIDGQIGGKNIASELDNIQNSLNAISELIENPSLLSSLKNIIKLLTDDDGNTSLSNLANSVSVILEKVNLLESNAGNLSSNLEILSIFADNAAKNFTYSAYVNTNNPLVATLANEYNYGCDKNRFANCASSNLRDFYTSAIVEGITDEGERETLTLTGNDIQINLNNAYSASDSIVINGVTLSNYRVLSAYGYRFSFNDNQCTAISVELTHSIEGDEIIPSINNTFTDQADFPGSMSFNLNFIPIRSGMLKYKEGDGFQLACYLSGTSDVDIYWIKNANIINGYDSLVTINCNNNIVTHRKQTTLTNCNDADLDLVFSKRLAGGSTIVFSIDNTLTSSADASITEELNDNLLTAFNDYNLIGAICPIRLQSEGNNLTLNVKSATIEYTEDKITTLHVTYALTGGYTGDKYVISLTCNGNSIDIPSGNNRQIVIDNDDITSYNQTISFENNNGFINLNVGGTLSFILTKENETSPAISNSATISQS